MATELFANYVATTVPSGGTTAPSSGSTETWTVTSSSGFPAAVTGTSQFHVADPALPGEVIAVTNVSGTTWSVTRGAESTATAAHTAGFTVKQVVSAGWLTSVGGSGVTSVTAGDTSIVVGGSGSAPTIATGTLDVIAADHPPAANWSNNSKKITSLANGTAASDAAAFGQLPVLAAADTSAVVGGTSTAPTVRTGTLDVIAAQHPAAADWSNNSHKITSLANGSGAQDAAAYGQLPVLAAADTSVVVAGTATAPTVRTSTLDVIAADHPAAADWSNNSHKITSLANGSGAQDAAAFGQIPLADTTAGNILPLGTQAAGSNGKWADSGHVHSSTASNGIGPATSGFTAFAAGGCLNALNTSSGNNTAMVAGTIYYAALWIPFNVTLTGIIVTIGATGGTDKWIAALYSASGSLLANSATAGTTAGTTATKQAFAFTGTYAATGPAVYYIGLQSNGTTATFRSFTNALEGFATGTKTGNSFGTLTLGTPATSYTANVGPFANTY